MNRTELLLSETGPSTHWRIRGRPQTGIHGPSERVTQFVGGLSAPTADIRHLTRQFVVVYRARTTAVQNWLLSVSEKMLRL
jgi:hypothetical protein